MTYPWLVGSNWRAGLGSWPPTPKCRPRAFMPSVTSVPSQCMTYGSIVKDIYKYLLDCEASQFWNIFYSS